MCTALFTNLPALYSQTSSSLPTTVLYFSIHFVITDLLLSYWMQFYLHILYAAVHYVKFETFNYVKLCAAITIET